MMNERMKPFFEDLGRPTMRGIRKCPKCGTYNGTRGMRCKNKACNLVFKEGKEKKKVIKHLNGSKLLTGSDSQIYSVRLRDRGSDLRGFVLLPLIEGLDGIQAAPEIELIVQSASQCHIESCPRSKQDFSEVTLSMDTCRHITAAIATVNQGTALPLKNSVLQSLSISNDMKQEIWKLATETSGPIVQRVAKSVMVVKCKTDSQRSLGYVHFYLFDQNKKSSLGKALCECEMPFVNKPATWNWEQSGTCIHYYACVCAFLSNKKLTEEFDFFLNAEMQGFDHFILQDGSLSNSNIIDEEHHNGIIFYSSTESSDHVTEVAKRGAECGDFSHKKKKRKSDIDPTGELISKTSQKSKAKIISTKGIKPNPVILNEKEANFCFMSWLGSVTERINQTMHFKFFGKPEPLVFHVPQIFFDCLQQRISSSSMKKRLPNTTTTFTSADTLPLGTFTKYTWLINNCLHAKQIFDTPEVPLQITRNFIENEDGSCDIYDPKNRCKQSIKHYKKNDKNPLIKMLKLKTFLKIGAGTSGITLEWIPNILPLSAIGELRIFFEFGHMRNGQLEIPVLPRSDVI